MSDRETSTAIDEAAADWVTRLDAAALSDAEQAAFDQWIASDPRRAGAFIRAQAVFEHLRRSKALGPTFNPERFAGADAHASLSVEHAPSFVTSRRFMLTGTGAAAAAVALAVFLPARKAAAAVYETSRGELRTFSLPGGISLALDSDTRAVFERNKAGSLIRLDRGIVLIDAHALAQPISITAGGGLIRLTDAQINVCRLAGTEVEATVCQGSAVWELRGRRSDLPARTRARINGNRLVSEQLSDKAVARLTAWRQGQLAFEDTALSDAALQFGRYSDRRLVFADPSIGRETVTGLYASSDVAGFARSAAVALGLRVAETPGAIVLTR